MKQISILPTRALSDPELALGDIKVLGAIGTYTSVHSGTGCFASSNTIAGLAGVSQRSVFRAVKVLEARGYILRVRRVRPDGSDTSSTYEVLLDEPRGGDDKSVIGGCQPRQTGDDTVTSPLDTQEDTQRTQAPYGSAGTPKVELTRVTGTVRFEDLPFALRLASIANRAWEKAHEEHPSPWTQSHAYHLAEALTTAGAPEPWALVALAEAVERCRTRPRTLSYFRSSLVELWTKERQTQEVREAGALTPEGTGKAPIDPALALVLERLGLKPTTGGERND